MDIRESLVPYAFKTWTIEMGCWFVHVTEFGILSLTNLSYIMCNNKELEQNNLLVLHLRHYCWTCLKRKPVFGRNFYPPKDLNLHLYEKEPPATETFLSIVVP